MKFNKIQSFAKINLTLKILKKLPNGYHEIESLISKISLADEILIKEVNGKKNKITSVSYTHLTLPTSQDV